MRLNSLDVSRSFLYVGGEGESWTAIKLTDIAGKYQDIIFTYGKVGIDEDKENDVASLQFDYNVVVSPTIPKEDLDDDMDFKNVLGDILIHILEEQLSKDALQYVNTDDRKNNSQ